MRKKHNSRVIRLRVKEIATERKINMAALARKADIDIRTLRRIYKEPTAEVSTYTIDKLARALDVSPVDLIEVIKDD